MLERKGKHSLRRSAGSSFAEHMSRLDCWIKLRSPSVVMVQAIRIVNLSLVIGPSCFVFLLPFSPSSFLRSSLVLPAFFRPSLLPPFVLLSFLLSSFPPRFPAFLESHNRSFPVHPSPPVRARPFGALWHIIGLAPFGGAHDHAGLSQQGDLPTPAPNDVLRVGCDANAALGRISSRTAGFRSIPSNPFLAEAIL